MEWLQALAAEFALTASTGVVWLSIGQASLLAGVCLAIGAWTARKAGFLDPSAPAGETVSVGLACGVLVVTVGWAAVASGGRSSFTPIALSFGVALALIVVRRSRPRGVDVMGSLERRSTALSLVAGAAFLAIIALLYGSTMQLQPRDGVQPLEFMDTAFYAILGADLATTGVENVFSPAGFGRIDGLPAQTWYHWGEMWLAALADTVFNVASLEARSFIVLPVLLLAAASMTGTLVRRMLGTDSRGAFAFGFVACLFLAPVPVVAGPFFGEWAVGLIFGITQYGLAAVAVPLALFIVAVPRPAPPTWAAAGVAAGFLAVILPTHILIALLACVAASAVWFLRLAPAVLRTRSLSAVRSGWLRVFVWAVALMVATVGWAMWTGHEVSGNGASPSVSPFNAIWRESVLLTFLGAGALLVIPIAWLWARNESQAEAEFYLGSMAVVAAGAVAWGARLGDFNMFHVYFSAIVVFATPAAAVAVWSIWRRLRAAGHPYIAIAILVLTVTQIEIGAVRGTQRLQRFGPGNYAPVPIDLLSAIRDLPNDAKIAYSCQPGEELSVWDGRLLGIAAHTGRRIMPMCFVSDALGPLVGGDPSPDVMSPTFASAPQRSLFPTASTVPTESATLSFLRKHGIGFIYVDAAHPNELPVDAGVIFAVGEFQVLRIP